MSIHCISWAFKQRNISPTEKLLLIALADHANDDGECWPGQKHLAEKCCVSRETVSRNLSSLEANGFIKSIRKRDDRGRDVGKDYILQFTPPGVTDNHIPCDGESQDPVTESHTSKGNRHLNRHGNILDKTKKPRFVRPSLEEITSYCTERKNTVDAQKFMDHYESNGWRVGKNAMKDWRAAVRTWEKNDYGSQNGSGGRPRESDRDRMYREGKELARKTLGYSGAGTRLFSNIHSGKVKPGADAKLDSKIIDSTANVEFDRNIQDEMHNEQAIPVPECQEK